MTECLKKEVGITVAKRVINGKRRSTVKQQQVAWTALQDWLRINPEQGISISSLLEFFIFLKDTKKLSPVTIRNYRSYLLLPIQLVANVNLKDWRFKEFENSFFIETPKSNPSIPSWSVQKVLDLLKEKSYDSDSCVLYNLLKKSVFLVALATANRVSEMAAMWLPFSKNISENSLQIPIKPGFLFKNQRLGRNPPNIVVASLTDGNNQWCPVKTLETYLRRSGRSRGPLFCNSKTNNPLKASTISHLLCSLINEADPGCFPKAHDVRKAATSLAWTRGLRMDEITKRAFWTSSNVFIDRYLHPRAGQGVALNTHC